MFATTLACAVVAIAAVACDEEDKRRAMAAERGTAQVGRAAPEPDAVVGCRLRAEGPPGLPRFEPERDFRAGPATFHGLRSLGETARRRPGVVFKRRREGYAAIKVLAGIKAGRPVTVAIAPSSRGRAGLVYDARSKRSGPLLRLNETERAVEFRPCRRDEPRFDGNGTVGRRTDFSGGFLVTKAHCLRLRVSTGDRPARGYALAYGVPEGSC